MIAETLAGIALVKQSVDFIKSQINTAKDIGQLAGAVDGLFRGHDEIEKERSKSKGNTYQVEGLFGTLADIGLRNGRDVGRGRHLEMCDVSFGDVSDPRVPRRGTRQHSDGC